MNEVKVKAYGLINFTKKQYLIVQSLGFLLLIVLLLLSIKYDTASSEDSLLKYATIGIAIILILEVIETAVMLRKFKMAEVKQQNHG